MSKKSYIPSIELMRSEQILYNVLMNKLMKEAEDKLYFTPSIEDIRIGYECEINQENINPNFRWTPYIVGEGYENITIARAIGEVQWQGIRVPYLTKEQIIAEGWNLLKKFDNNYIYADKGWSELRYDMSHNMLAVYNILDPGHDIGRYPAFYGECKDINTFRYICKLLNI